jgi:hypothetical protein
MDPVKPKHYSRWKIEPIEFIRANELDFYRANIIKYIMRHDAKDGLKDLEKALQYLKWYIEDMYPTPDGHNEFEIPTGVGSKGPWRMEATYPIGAGMTEAELIVAERALYEEGWTS